MFATGEDTATSSIGAVGTARLDPRPPSVSGKELGREHMFGPAQSDDQHNLRDFLQIHKHIMKIMKQRIMVVTAPTVTFVAVSFLGNRSVIIYEQLISSEQIPNGQL